MTLHNPSNRDIVGTRQSMTSLKTKLFVIITLIVSASSLVTLNQQQLAMTGIAQRNADILTETVKGSITDAMLSGNSQDISRILSQISGQKLISTLRIIDESGKVLNSANKDEIGKTAFSKALLAYKRHLPVSTRLVDNQFVSISPILNSPSCSVCHDPATKVLGLLEIETPAEYLQSFLSDSKRHIFFTAAIIILLLTIAIFFILVRNEGEFGRAQEKLAHHNDIHLMNEQLKIQLAEIEALNISLVEPIDEANRASAPFAREQQQSYLSTIK